MTELRSLIRELLAEELHRIKRDTGPAVREETATIVTDNDLQAFARRVLQIADKPGGADDVRQGRIVFRLQGRSGDEASQGPGVSPTQASNTLQGTTEALGKNLITERDVGNLPESVTTVSIGRHSRLTPLAKDELRRRGINIQRKSP